MTNHDQAVRVVAEAHCLHVTRENFSSCRYGALKHPECTVAALHAAGLLKEDKQ
ncbi:MAG: hypothetical protein M3404_01890 [Actinomycetota bacterium]|nr:hypothetical protein [Actinomycetota bacterium]